MIMYQTTNVGHIFDFFLNHRLLFFHSFQNQKTYKFKFLKMKIEESPYNGHS
jgi:hypothetical protein